MEEEIKDSTDDSNQLLETEKMLDKEFVETVKQAEGKEVTLVANALKRRSEERAEERKIKKEALKVLQDKRKKLE